MKLERDFYTRPCLEVAAGLIGKRLVHQSREGVTAGIIVETEAYIGLCDAASHAYGLRRTARTAVQYGPGGFAYIYMIYGLHTCMNVVANRENVPEAVLIRALEPTEGLALMGARRGQSAALALCSGPGKLAQAMGICREDYGADLCGDQLYIETAEPSPPVSATARINVDYAGEAAAYPWRFVWTGSPYVSVPPRGGK